MKQGKSRARSDKGEKLSESKIRKYKLAYWLPILVFLVGMSILGISVHFADADHERYAREKAELNASTYSQHIIGDLNNGVAVTTALEQIVISEQGGVNNFDVIAKNLITDYIQCIQLAPNGVVNQIYPLEGNESGMIDLINDPDRGPVAQYGRDNDVITMQGPFNLKQGGLGIAVRNPVFLENATAEETEKQFWGFTVVIIKVPEIFDNSLVALESFGYDYKLKKTAVLSGEQLDVISRSDEELTDPAVYSFYLGSCHWTLEVEPLAGWNADSNAMAILWTGCLLMVCVAAITWLLLIVAQRGKHYKDMATVDVLTGLLNRAGFENEFDKYMSEHPDERCVEAVLDIDDFKLINDLYGHNVGDKALGHLASELKSAFTGDVILARSGGDEFNIVFKNADNAAVAEKLKKFTLATKYFLFNDRTHGYTISLGYAEYPAQAKKRSELTSKSDIALYEAKLHGKHNCLAYSSDFHIESRSKLGFGLKDVSENVPSAFFIYKANPNDETILFANQEMISLTGCKDFKDFITVYGGKFQNLIHPDERESVESSIWDQIKNHRNGSDDYVRYRLKTKDGSYKQVLDHGRIVDSSTYGKVFYVLIIDAKFIEAHYINCSDKRN